MRRQAHGFLVRPDGGGIVSALPIRQRQVMPWIHPIRREPDGVMKSPDAQIEVRLAGGDLLQVGDSQSVVSISARRIDADRSFEQRARWSVRMIENQRPSLTEQHPAFVE